MEYSVTNLGIFDNCVIPLVPFKAWHTQISDVTRVLFAKLCLRGSLKSRAWYSKSHHHVFLSSTVNVSLSTSFSRVGNSTLLSLSGSPPRLSPPPHYNHGCTMLYLPLQQVQRTRLYTLRYAISLYSRVSLAF